MKSLIFGTVSVPIEKYRYHHVSSRTPATVIIGLETDGGPDMVQLTWPSETAMSNDLLKLAAQVNPQKIS